MPMSLAPLAFVVAELARVRVEQANPLVFVAELARVRVERANPNSGEFGYKNSWTRQRGMSSPARRVGSADSVSSTAGFRGQVVQKQLANHLSGGQTLLVSRALQRLHLPVGQQQRDFNHIF